MPQAISDRYNEHAVAKFYAAARDGSQKDPGGPSGRGTEPDNVTLPFGVLESRPVLGVMIQWLSLSISTPTWWP